jgi:predicted N-acetyltransferase YhbS
MMLRKTQPEVVVRTAAPEDSLACGQICYDAFSTINATHGYPCDFPGSEAAVGLLSMMFSSPDFYCVVAKVDGRIVGSNCLDERSVIRGVGPITIDPGAQNLGVGRKLMQAVMDRANQSGAPGIRLVQAAFHNRSLSLYTSLGFDIREPLSCMQGRTLERSIPGCVVRPAKPRRCGRLQCSITAGSWIRSRRRLGSSNRAGHRGRSGTRRPRYRIHNTPGLFRPFHGGD